MTSMKNRLSPALVISVIALFVALGGVGVAATGDNFILGQTNTADSTSFVNGSIASGPMLELTNTTGSGLVSRSPIGRGIVGQHTGTSGKNPGVEASTSSSEAGALGLTATNSGGGAAASFSVLNNNIAPLTVNSRTKVANLNADSIDGFDSSRFVRKDAGDVHLWYSPFDYFPYGSVTVIPSVGPAVDVSTGIAGDNKSVIMALDQPQDILGAALKFKSIKICYRSVGAYIDFVRVEYGEGAQQNGVVFSINTHSSTTDDCFTLLPSAPLTIAGSAYLQVGMNYPTASDYIWLESVEVTLGT